MKIIHSADIQVKSREKDLVKATKKTLTQIENEIEKERAEIYIMAGDLFEYPTPTDQERKLMYNHISRLLNIPTLKEIVIMAGNHDLLKSKKESETTIGHNPINVFIDLLNNLDAELCKKIIYINQSKVYKSNISKDFQYVGYSLEDDENFEALNYIDEESENGDIVSELDLKFNICLFHGMLKEYVDQAKLPLRKDIYSALSSIEKFPANSLITAGDIHLNLRFEGLNGQLFIYPGSPMQHTHNEGHFLKVNGETLDVREAENKVLYKYEFESPKGNEKLKLSDIQISNIPLKHTVSYLTIELNNKISFETLKTSLKNLDLISLCADQNFVKIKSSNVFLKHEQEIHTILSSYLGMFEIKFQIVFEYDKLIQTANTVNNKVIQEILTEKNDELIQKFESENSENSETEVKSDFKNILNTTNIDDLILTDKQIIKLFTSVLDDSLKSVDDSDITNNELSLDIRALFEKEINNFTQNSRRYNIIFENIVCNCFMALCENDIDLNIPGITRILGTNGIGKTTLYSMLRWVISGEVFGEMSKNQVMKNNLIVFNKNRIDIDFVEVKLKTNINNLDVLLTRTVERKWKNNTTDEQKASLRWKNFISTVDRNFKINFTTSSGEAKEFVGDVAEKSIALWFGDTLNNIMFMNQVKLEKLLSTASDRLNEMVLDFVGIDYLKKLENNLDNVKNELMTVSKPTKTKEDISNKILDLKIFVEKSQKALEDGNINKKNIETELNDINEKLVTLNNELLNIGNIPNLLKEFETSSEELQTFLSTFEKKEKQQKIKFELEAPILDETKTSEFDSEIDSKTKIIEREREKINELKDLKNKIISDNLKDLINNQTLKSNKIIQIYESNDSNYQEDLKNNYQLIVDYYDDTLKKLNDKKTEKYNEKVRLETENKNYKTQIDENEISIASGICDKCGKPFTEDSGEHSLSLQMKNDELQNNINHNKPLIEELETFLVKCNTAITNCGNNRDLAFNKNKSILEKEINNIALTTIIKKINKLYFDITENQNLYTIELKVKENWKLHEKIQYSNYEIQNVIDNEELNKIINHHKKACEGITISETFIENITEEIDKIKELKTAYQNLYISNLQEYQKLLDENTKANNKVDEFNITVDEHNSQLPIKESELSKLLIKIGEYKETKLPEYNLKKSEYDDWKLVETEKNESWEAIKKSIHNEELKLKDFENAQLLVQREYENYLKYQKNNLVWKIYSKLIKNNFKEIIFEYYRTFLNGTLNTLLEDVPFKLFWDENSELFHISYNNGVCTYQPVQQSSGMETTYLALALVYTIHLLNVKNSISHIFIDEISGTLNAGTELSYEAQNYKELLVLVLNKFKDKSIFIIDHSIENLFQTVTYEVRPTEKGSKYFVNE